MGAYRKEGTFFYVIRLYKRLVYEKKKKKDM